MARENYRLEPLLRVRRITADKAAALLQQAEKARKDATLAKERAENEIARAELEASKIREQARHPAVAVSAADLAAVDAWETREQKERAERSSRLKAAEDRVGREREREHIARAQVEKARAQAQVVEQDREKWQAREDRKDELLREERANEEWAKRSG